MWTGTAKSNELITASFITSARETTRRFQVLPKDDIFVRSDLSGLSIIRQILDARLGIKPATRVRSQYRTHDTDDRPVAVRMPDQYAFMEFPAGPEVRLNHPRSVRVLDAGSVLWPRGAPATLPGTPVYLRIRAAVAGKSRRASTAAGSLWTCGLLDASLLAFLVAPAFRWSRPSVGCGMSVLGSCVPCMIQHKISVWSRKRCSLPALSRARGLRASAEGSASNASRDSGVSQNPSCCCRQVSSGFDGGR